jgi:ERCC4-type nuclease
MHAHLKDLGVTVVRRMLWAGDYEVGDRALVERKTVRGLHLAIVKGTFWPQIGRLRRVSRFPYLLIEGTTLDLGVSIIRTEGLADSAQWLHRLAERRATHHSRSRPGYAQRAQRLAGMPAAQAALAAVPGISTVRAQALLDRFGTLAAVVSANESEWEEVRGIGPRRSRAMALTFHAATTASGGGRGGGTPRGEPQGLAT